MKKYFLIVIALCLTAVIAFCGCSENEYAGNTYTVKVTSIENGKYTAVIGTVSDSAAPQGGQMPMHTFEPDGTFLPMGSPPPVPLATDEMKYDAPPQGMEGDIGIKPAPTGEPYVKPLESPPPFDGAPALPGGEFNMQTEAVVFTATEGTLTFTVEDGCAITKNGQTASVSEITVDSILNVTFNNNGNVCAVEVVF